MHVLSQCPVKDITVILWITVSKLYFITARIGRCHEVTAVVFYRMFAYFHFLTFVNVMILKKVTAYLNYSHALAGASCS